MFRDLNNKKVLITGSSSGIGFEIAKNFIESGCSVVLNGRNKKKLNQSAKSIYNSFVVDGDVENPKVAKKIATPADIPPVNNSAVISSK